MENTCGQRQSRIPLSGSAFRQLPGHKLTHTGVFPFQEDRHRRVAGHRRSLPGATPAVGSGCPHHPVTMVPIQPFIPEGKNVSRKETKTEKGNSLELSM